jgi:hypothetical protein
MEDDMHDMQQLQHLKDIDAGAPEAIAALYR